MSVQYLVWVVGVVQIVRFRRRTRRAIAESEDGLYAAMRALRGPLRLSARVVPEGVGQAPEPPATRGPGPLHALRDHFVTCVMWMSANPLKRGIDLRKDTGVISRRTTPSRGIVAGQGACDWCDCCAQSGGWALVSGG